MKFKEIDTFKKYVREKGHWKESLNVIQENETRIDYNLYIKIRPLRISTEHTAKLGMYKQN